jgi:hypothetical protein
MNKKLVYGMIALLLMSLFFLGCPTDSGDDSPGSALGGKAPPQSAEQAAKNQIDNLTSNAGFSSGSVRDDGSVVITASGFPIDSDVAFDAGQNVIIQGAVTTGAGFEMDVGNDTDVTFEAGLSLVSGSELNVGSGSSVSIPQSLTHAGTTNIYGEFLLGGGAVGNNNGTFHIFPGGKFKADAGNIVGGNGTTIVEVGGEVYLDGQPVAIVGGSGAVITLTEGTFEVHANSNPLFVLKGKATLNKRFNWNTNIPVELSPTSELLVTAELNIGTGGLGTIKGALNSGNPGSKIIVSSTGSITTATNFYPAASNTAGTCVPGTTYVWDGSAGGSGTAGWKAQS